MSLLPGLHRQSQASQRRESWHSSEGASNLASPYLLASRFYWFLHTPRRWAPMALWRSLNPPTPTPYHSVPQLRCPLRLKSLLLFRPRWIPHSLKTTHPTRPSLIKKQPGLIFLPLTSNSTQEYQTLGVYLLILQNQNPTVSPVNSSSAGGMSYLSCKWNNEW